MDVVMCHIRVLYGKVARNSVCQTLPPDSGITGGGTQVDLVV